MKQLSVEVAYQWAQRFAGREWPLLLPVALAFFALPGLLVDIFMPDAMMALRPDTHASMAAQNSAFAAFSAILFFRLWGGLALLALALVPAISVREAIVRAARRLPTLIGALLLVAAALLLAMLVAALPLTAARAAPAVMQGLVLAVIIVAGIFLSIRLTLICAVAVTMRGGPVPMLRQSWELSRGVFWRLFGGVVIYIAGATLTLVATGVAVGTVLTLLARTLGVVEIGTIMTSIVFQTLAALVSTGMQLLIAGLYRQLAGGGS